MQRRGCGRPWWSLTKPEGWRDEAQLEEWSPEATDGRRQTKADPEGRGSPAEQVGICEPPGFQGWCALPTHTHQIATPSMGSTTDKGTTGLNSGTESLSLSRTRKQELSLGWTGDRSPL